MEPVTTLFEYDRRLSWSEKGILQFGLRQIRQKFDIHDLKSASRDKRAVLYTALGRLGRLGYLEMRKERDDKGQMAGVMYTAYAYRTPERGAAWQADK